MSEPKKFEDWHNVLCAWCDTKASGNALHVYYGQWFASCGSHGHKYEPFPKTSAPMTRNSR